MNQSCEFNSSSQGEVCLQKGEHGNIGSSFNYIKRFNIAQTAAILDVGCSYGSLIFNLFKVGFCNIEGLDISRDYIENGKIAYPQISQHINLYDGEIIPFPSETFDTVLMFDVIEHIPHVELFLKEVYRVLKKGGLFIFQTPNKPVNILWVYINNRTFDINWAEGHCSLQTPRSLIKILKMSGFSEITLEKFNIVTEHNITKVRRRLGWIGILLLKIVAFLPLSLSTNLWGHCRKR